MIQGTGFNPSHDSRHAAPAAGAAAPTTTGSLAALWILWKEQQGRVEQRRATRDVGERVGPSVWTDAGSNNYRTCKHLSNQW